MSNAKDNINYENEYKAAIDDLKKAQINLTELQSLVDSQAKDEGLWFDARTAPEAYLQQELRILHQAVENTIGGQAYGDQKFIDKYVDNGGSIEGLLIVNILRLDYASMKRIVDKVTERMNDEG